MDNNSAPVEPTTYYHLQLLTTTQVADILGVSVRTVQHWIKNGTIPHIRLGEGERLVRIRAVDLERFIETYRRARSG